MFDPGDLVCGLLDTSPQFLLARDAELARSRTISWLRFKYSGEIIESQDLRQLLIEASLRGYRYCLLQSYGHIILEQWRPGDQQPGVFLGRLGEWIDQNHFGAIGDERCLLVDLAEFERAGRPTFSSEFFNRGKPNGTVAAIAGLKTLSLNESSQDPSHAVLLQEMETLKLRSTRGVFLWNFEPYSDIEAAPAGFRRPLTTLYSVAAGFKPNRILRTHGFSQATRVVFFDYSRSALEFQRLLHEHWDGKRYPAFLRWVFGKIPASEAHYWLWDGMSPNNIDWEAMEQMWRRELVRWGGESNIAEHWRNYRELHPEYIHCDLLSDAEPLFLALRNERDAMIWWSNVFSTVYGNWTFTVRERREMFERWIHGLASGAPQIYLCGSDACNISVNGCTVVEYQGRLRDSNELKPVKMCRREIRF
jgi:hypothetical protein